MLYVLAFAAGAAVVGIIWWIDHRSLKGVISDLEDAKNVTVGRFKKN
jgi:hypothetical protein